MNQGRRFQLEEERGEEPSMLMTSMIDVIFILLACFIGVSELKKGAVEVDVPEVPDSAIEGEPEGEPIVVEVDADEAVYVAGVRAQDDVDLERLLTQAASESAPNTSVQLRGDRTVSFERMVQLVARINRCGFERVRCRTKQGS
ncbi:MAG: biopolymer transporter ExbD [Planctomycetota bacterium]